MSIINNFPGGGGVDVSAVTAAANDVRSGKVIVDKNGDPIVGSVPTRGSGSISFTGGTVYVPSGIYDSSIFKYYPNNMDIQDFFYSDPEFSVKMSILNYKLRLEMPALIFHADWDHIRGLNVTAYAYGGSGNYNLFSVSMMTGDFSDLTERPGNFTYATGARRGTVEGLNWTRIDDRVFEFGPHMDLGPDRGYSDFTSATGFYVIDMTED